MIKSPLRYPGGKSRAIGTISQILPSFDEFREPFVGGGSVFVYLKQLFPKKKFWVNDLYFELFKFWEMSQTAFFIYNRITFSGTSLSGGYSEAAFKGRFTESSIQRLSEFATLVHHNTQITNLDYQEVVEKKGKNVFIFLDPPYYSATKSALYGKNGHLHKAFDHQKFAQTMQQCKHKWLITYDDSPYIRELFSFANITPWTLTYGMRNVTDSSDQKGKELFISNYPLNKT